MRWNVYPNYKIPIDYVTYDEFGEQHVSHIGWVVTPDLQVLKDDHYANLELVQR